jgi:glycosyltransferase involved in cell wall biosynthesis
MQRGKRPGHEKRRLKIGIISPPWLPVCGGGEKYVHDLAAELISCGIDVRVFCGTRIKKDFDNGDIDAKRFDAGVDVDWTLWGPPEVTNPENMRRTLLDYRFMEEALKWVRATDIKIALVCNPIQRTEVVHARELYAGLRGLGVVTGIVHLDLPMNITDFVIRTYLEKKCSWEIAALITEQEIKSFLADRTATEGYYLIGSPLFFSPDFVISCSEWNLRFINPLMQVPQLVLHPLLDLDYFSTRSPSEESLPYRDVLMINPAPRKGAEQMLNLVANPEHHWTYRIMRGGWGNGMNEILPHLEAMPAFRAGRVALVDYLKDIRAAYRSCGVLFFPSLIEGYGMTTVEAMASGAPVVSSDYPAIIEAIGDDAIALCPLKTSKERWVEAIRDALSNREYWASKGLARVTRLKDRQRKEMDALIAFLAKFS